MSNGARIVIFSRGFTFLVCWVPGGPWVVQKLFHHLDFSFTFLFKFLFGKALFGRSLAQLILAALSLYPFGVKEGQKQRFLSYVPLGRFCLAMYPSADVAVSGAS